MVEKSRRAVDLANARSLRSALTSALLSEEVTIKDEVYGVCIVVDKNGVKTGVCNKKNGSVKGGTSKVKGNIKEVIEKSGLEKTTIKQTKNKWYAVAVYGDGSSYYYEGVGTPKLNEKNKREWTELAEGQQG